MKVIITFDIDDAACKLILEQDLRKVIDKSIELVIKSPTVYEDEWINREDWKVWRPVVFQIWRALHEEIYRSGIHQYGVFQSDRVFHIRKGGS